MADENGAWRTISGRRVFIKEGQSLSDAMKESSKFSTSKEDIEKKILIEALKEKLEENDIEVNDDNTVTLYHVTSAENYEKIMDEGFKGTYAPIGGGTGGEEVGARSFFWSRQGMGTNYMGRGQRQVDKNQSSSPIHTSRNGKQKRNLY